jgi:(5-formylfuran-3-yl)methyl phosphate synthase
MTGFLASIAKREELDAVLEGGADIIDVKDPEAGALGAAAPAIVAAIIAAVAGRRQVSATVGDLPMIPAQLSQAVRRTASLGVDYVKVGIFSGGDALACIRALARVAGAGRRLVAVLFADRAPDFAILQRLADAGFAGAMLDTADKRRGRLTSHLGPASLSRFVSNSHRLGLLTGLAGSLALGDIAPLATLGADYLGFRGALCADGRTGAIAAARVRAVRQALDQASHATAAAGAATAAASRISSDPSTISAKSR